MGNFQSELEKLINKHSIENKCDIPDFILAEMIVGFVENLSNVKAVLDWHGCNSVCHPQPNNGVVPTVEAGITPQD